MPKLLTWNVAGRIGERLARQIEVVAREAAHVVCLQEVTPTTLPRWRAAFAELRYTTSHSELPPGLGHTRRLMVLTATRLPLGAPTPSLAVPWAERHLRVRVRTDAGEIVIHNLHAP